MDDITPKDHAEAVAIFKSQVIGALTRRQLTRGELCTELRRISAQRFRPPGSDTTRTYDVPTLERWYYRYKKGGLDALRPKPRRDKGRARELAEAQKTLLLDIRREHPTASAALILRTLVADGRLDRDAVSLTTIRRLYQEHGLDRASTPGGQKTRLRWQAERPGALWHGDVCHAPSILVDGVRRPVRIHALLDDASRYVTAIEARHTEREIDMIFVLVGALRRHGSPDALYLDNGPTYSGDVLRVACARLGISLIHPRPHDPEARGKMERFWRTLREGCLNHIGSVASLHEINARLFAFIDQHYHASPHAGLLGACPTKVWTDAERARPVDDFDEKKLRDALTVRARRRIRRDSTVSVRGQDFELEHGYLAGRLVHVAFCPLDESFVPWIEHNGRRIPLHPVDVVKNAHRRRRSPGISADDSPKTVRFDPTGALLDRACGRVRDEEESK